MGDKESRLSLFHFRAKVQEVILLMIRLIVEEGKPKSLRVTFKKSQSTQSYAFSKSILNIRKGVCVVTTCHECMKIYCLCYL